MNLCTLVFRHRWASTGSHSWNLNILSVVSSSQKSTREATTWNSAIVHFLPSPSLSFIHFFSFLFLYSFFFFFISLFLFRRIFSNPFFPLFSRNFLFLLFLSPYFLNYPRGFFHPLFFSFFGDILIVSSLCSTSPLSWIRLASFSVITTTPLFTLLSTPFDQPFRHVLVS